MPLYVCLWAFTGGLVWFCSRSLIMNPEVDWKKGKMEYGQTPQDAYRYKQYRLNNNFLNPDGDVDPKTQVQSPVISSTSWIQRAERKTISGNNILVHKTNYQRETSTIPRLVANIQIGFTTHPKLAGHY